MSPIKVTRASRSQTATTATDAVKMTSTSTSASHALALDKSKSNGRSGTQNRVSTTRKIQTSTVSGASTSRSSSVLSVEPLTSESESEFESAQPTAGPSTPRRSAPRAVLTPGSTSDRTVGGSEAKGKGKAPEKRVLPARIRRSAGGGEGMRDVEEMIVDWLERWGEPSTTPPDDLPIYLTSLPLSYVQPPPTAYHQNTQPDPPPPSVTITPTRRKSEVEGSEGRIGKEEKIEVPSWVMVKSGEDDEEEAREELELGLGVRAKGKLALSPVKRLRRGGIGEEPEQDTSDAYYIQLHKKYEVFERRQRIREKEKLQFERYKMRSRIDLLRNMPKMTWSTVVSTIIARGPDEWVKGKEKIREKGPDWLKGKLINEGEEIMLRYEELLPPEQRKPKTQTPQQPDSRLSTPFHASPSLSPSLTPPPNVLPARVAALRDPSTSSAKRKRRATDVIEKKPVVTNGNDTPSKVSQSTERRSSPRVSRSNGKRKRSDSEETPEIIAIDDDGEVINVSIIEHGSETPSKTPSRPKNLHLPPVRPSDPLPAKPISSLTNVRPIQPAIPGRPLYPIFARTVRPPSIATTVPIAPSPAATPVPKTAPPPATKLHTPIQPKDIQALATSTNATQPYPPRLPVLVQAASRRELLQNTELVNGNSSRSSASVDPDQARARYAQISSMAAASPFGMPVPDEVERQYEFSIRTERDFWPIISRREEQARTEVERRRRAQDTAILPPPAPLVSSTNPKPSAPTSNTPVPPAQVLPAKHSPIRGTGKPPSVNGIDLARPVKAFPIAKVDYQAAMTPEEVAEIEGVEAAVVL